MNTFGHLFKVTTWGESHGHAIGVIVDGCPAGLTIDQAAIQQDLNLRAPGKNNLTSPRKEKDIVQVLSGVYQGHTTGAPIAMMIVNTDARSEAYQPIQHLFRPGHANYTYHHKYGSFDHRGGGRASARETACRVMAGSVAKQLLGQYGIEVLGFLSQMGVLKLRESSQTYSRQKIYQSPVYCPDKALSQEMSHMLTQLKSEGDSVGGVVQFVIQGCPIGLGEPVYGKIEAMLAQAMLSIPASKGFEIGMGFSAVDMKGSEHNDSFAVVSGQTRLSSNQSGGILGGITNGEPIWGRVAFKPTSSIKKIQQTTTLEGKSAKLKLGVNARHDPCVAIRAVPVVEAMAACTIADAWLMAQAYTKLESSSSVIKTSADD